MTPTPPSPVLRATLFLAVLAALLGVPFWAGEYHLSLAAKTVFARSSKSTFPRNNSLTS